MRILLPALDRLSTWKPGRHGRLGPRGAQAVLAVRRKLGIGVGRLAQLQRRRLGAVRFVGITGSCGKTTTKELAAAVLSARLQGVWSPTTRNSLFAVAATLVRTRVHHDFCLQEVGSWGTGTLSRSVALLRPDVAVVTNVGADHYKAFRSLEATAREKRTLVEGLAADGVAILNADDPHVAAMAAFAPGRVTTYGLAPDADVRATDVVDAWPDRLAFTVHHAGRSLPVRTRLCGAHLAPCVLAALAVGIELGVPLEDAVAAVAGVEPWRARMSPVELEDGVAFVRDDWKAPLWSVPPALAFLGRARSARRIAVIGTLSDYPGSNEKRYAAVARQALEAAEHVVFVGRWARGALRAAPAGRPEALRAFERVEEAAAHLREFLRPGDLVLLKGSQTVDHLERIVEARAAAIAAGRAGSGAAREPGPAAPGEGRAAGRGAAAEAGPVPGVREPAAGVGRDPTAGAGTPA
jgi:UDP-N-acetylmuramyl pentapeptide synthase